MIFWSYPAKKQTNAIYNQLESVKVIDAQNNRLFAST